MSVYSQISNNKKRTFFILFLFIFLVTGFFYLLGRYFQSSTAYFILGFIASLTSGLISYFYSDKIILFTVGAKPANKKDYFNLYTVTENLCIASGLPMPKLYVINDPSPNAFATGRDPKHAVICVTAGLLKILDRSDLEGVIAHELSHIKNYDILLASFISVLVGMISIVSDWLLRNFWWERQKIDKEENSHNPFIFILVFLSLIITPIIAGLIQLAISRRREYLADASSVLLTRNPNGLISALTKISQYPYSMKQATPAIAHLFIINPFKKKYSWFINLFSTHPPIEERIKLLKEM